MREPLHPSTPAACLPSSKRPRRNTQLDQNEVLKTRSRAPSPLAEDNHNEEPPLHLFFDSLKTNFVDLDGMAEDTESDGAEQDDWDELNDEQFRTAMVKMDDELQDPGWVPERLRRKAVIRAKQKTSQF